MREIVQGIAQERSLPLQLRLGMHTGPVVAGIIGLRKFASDIWGDTVNLASRMESTAPPGGIQVSEFTREGLSPLHELEARGSVEMRGEIATWLLKARRPGVAAAEFPASREPALSLAAAITRGPTRSGGSQVA